MTPNYLPSPPSLYHSPSSPGCSCSSCVQISPFGADIENTLAPPGLRRSIPKPKRGCDVCPLTVLGEWCYKCKDTITEETFEFPPLSSSPRLTTLVGKPWYQTGYRREISPSPSPRWCSACARTTIGESCFVCASVVTEETFTFHPAPFTQGSRVIIGDVRYHTSRKRLNKLRRRLHEANDFEGYVDAPLPPIIMDFPKFKFGGLDIKGLAQEYEDDSLFGRASQLVAEGLITKSDDRMLTNICHLITEMWFYGRNVFESEMIDVSNPERLDQEDNYDWTALGLGSETHEDSILGLVRKLASMRYLTKNDEAVIENYCIDIAMRWAAVKDKPAGFQEPRLQEQEEFASQFEEVDALFDARTKLAQVHILAVDDHTESIYHLDAEMLAQIDFHTNMPSPQKSHEEHKMRRRSKHMLSKVEWEMLNSVFNRESNSHSEDVNSETDDESDIISSYGGDDEGESISTDDTESIISYDESDEDDESESLGIHIVDTVHDLPSLAQLSPLLFPSPMFSTASSSSYDSPQSSTCSISQITSPKLSLVSPLPRAARPILSAPTAETLQQRLQRQLQETATRYQSESSSAYTSGKGVECRMINEYGDAFEWAILL